MQMAHTRRAHGQPWTIDSDGELRQRCEAGEFLPAIAKAMGRSQEACRTRANIIGVSCRSSAGARRVGIHGEANSDRAG